MPRGDRTGPVGQGARTGRGLGYCNGYNSPGFTKPGPGLGLGRGYSRGYGRGNGRGYGRGYRRYANYPYPETAAGPYPYQPAPANSANEKEYLEERYNYLQQEMDEIKKRLDELQDEEE